MAIKEIKVPNIGDVSDVEVIEVLVSPGDKVQKEASLITLESDKASMEIPSPYDGVVQEVKVKLGDKVSEGALIVTLETGAGESKPQATPEKSEEKEVASQAPSPKPEKIEKPSRPEPTPESTVATGDEETHAGPAVRRLAREFGVDLQTVKGTGPKDRILKEDLQAYVKNALKSGGERDSAPGLSVAKMPEIDFSKFGTIEKIPLNKIKKLTGANVHRSWVTIPHVTQFGEADITDLEEFRKSYQPHDQKQPIKLTPLVFIMKAVIAGLKEFPHFNASLDSNGENLILKRYYNLGVAVDTPNGLVVPVIRDVDKKGMLELAHELTEISQKARQKGLSPADMAGSCFTISSLGGIGGTAFTPIINAPDVAILGVSKSSVKPIFKDGQFVPRLMLPLSLSYDHRVIDGADGARFIVYLANCLADIRTLLL